MNTVGTHNTETDGEPGLRAGRLPRLLPQRLDGGPACWEEHRARYGRLPAPGWDEGWRDLVIAEVGRSGPRSRDSRRAIIAVATAAAHPHTTSATHQIRRSLPAVTACANAAGQVR